MHGFFSQCTKYTSHPGLPGRTTWLTHSLLLGRHHVRYQTCYIGPYIGDSCRQYFATSKKYSYIYYNTPLIIPHADCQTSSRSIFFPSSFPPTCDTFFPSYALFARQTKNAFAEAKEFKKTRGYISLDKVKTHHITGVSQVHRTNTRKTRNHSRGRREEEEQQQTDPPFFSTEEACCWTTDPLDDNKFMFWYNAPTTEDAENAEKKERNQDQFHSCSWPPSFEDWEKIAKKSRSMKQRLEKAQKRALDKGAKKIEQFMAQTERKMCKKIEERARL